MPLCSLLILLFLLWLLCYWIISFMFPMLLCFPCIWWFNFEFYYRSSNSVIRFARPGRPGASNEFSNMADWELVRSRLRVWTISISQQLKSAKFNLTLVVKTVFYRVESLHSTVSSARTYVPRVTRTKRILAAITQLFEENNCKE